MADLDKVGGFGRIGPSEPPKKNSPGDPDKFKRVLEVEKSTESEERRKRKRKQDEQDEDEGISLGASPEPQAGAFNSMMTQQRPDNPFEIQSPSALPQAQAPTSSSPPPFFVPSPPPSAPADPDWGGLPQTLPPQESESEIALSPESNQPAPDTKESSKKEKPKEALPSKQIKVKQKKEAPSTAAPERKAPTEKPQLPSSVHSKSPFSQPEVRPEEAPLDLDEEHKPRESLPSLPKAPLAPPKEPPSLKTPKALDPSSLSVDEDQEPEPLEEEPTPIEPVTGKVAPERTPPPPLLRAERDPSLPLPAKEEKKKERHEHLDVTGAPVPIQGESLPQAGLPEPAPTYTTLNPNLFALFEKMSGIMIVMNASGSGDMKTTISLDQTHGVLSGAQVEIHQSRSAPGIFQLQFSGSPEAVALFEATTEDLAASFAEAKYSFSVNILRPVILSSPSPLVRRKNFSDDKDKEGRK